MPAKEIPVVWVEINFAVDPLQRLEEQMHVSVPSFLKHDVESRWFEISAPVSSGTNPVLKDGAGLPSTQSRP